MRTVKKRFISVSKLLNIAVCYVKVHQQILGESVAKWSHWIGARTTLWHALSNTLGCWQYLAKFGNPVKQVRWTKSLAASGPIGLPFAVCLQQSLPQGSPKTKDLVYLNDTLMRKCHGKYVPLGTPRHLPTLVQQKFTSIYQLTISLLRSLQLGNWMWNGDLQRNRKGFSVMCQTDCEILEITILGLRNVWFTR
jgi:hypothetical protein